MVGHGPLKPSILVRVQVPQPKFRKKDFMITPDIKQKNMDLTKMLGIADMIKVSKKTFSIL